VCLHRALVYPEKVGASRSAPESVEDERLDAQQYPADTYPHAEFFDTRFLRGMPVDTRTDGQVDCGVFSWCVHLAVSNHLH
jgi:hypothetical protein